MRLSHPSSVLSPQVHSRKNEALLILYVQPTQRLRRSARQEQRRLGSVRNSRFATSRSIPCSCPKIFKAWSRASRSKRLVFRDSLCSAPWLAVIDFSLLWVDERNDTGLWHFQSNPPSWNLMPVLCQSPNMEAFATSAASTFRQTIEWCSWGVGSGKLMDNESLIKSAFVLGKLLNSTWSSTDNIMLCR